MSGIEGGGLKYNYSSVFERGSVSEIQSEIEKGKSKEEFHDSALAMMKSTAESFQKMESTESKEKYLELAEKFVQIFPEDEEAIREINTVSHDVLHEDRSFTATKAGEFTPLMHGVDTVTREKLPGPAKKEITFDQLKPTSPAEVTTQLKNSKLGTIQPTRPDHPKYSNCLVIAVKATSEGPPGYGVKQLLLKPGEEEGKFLYAGGEYSIGDLIEKFGTIYSPPDFESSMGYKEAVQNALPLSARMHDFINMGADKDKLREAGKEIMREMILDDSLDEEAFKNNLTKLFLLFKSVDLNYDDIMAKEAAAKVAEHRSELKELLTSPKSHDISSLDTLREDLDVRTNSLFSMIKEGISSGYAAHFPDAVERFTENLNAAKFEEEPEKLQQLIKEYNALQKLSKHAKTPIPNPVKEAFGKKAFLPSSPILQKALEGKTSELSIEELSRLPAEIEAFNNLSLPPPKGTDIPSIASAILEKVKSHKREISDDPAISTKAHHILHDLAQWEIANGNVVNAFRIESQAAKEISLPESHPLHPMDKAILEGSSKQVDVSYGANFGSMDTTIVKGGHLHATQREIDGNPTDCFDFKLSHYAREELTEYLEAVESHPEEFKASLPKGFCTDVKINRDVSQEYIRYDSFAKEFTRDKGVNPGGSTATEIVFEGVGKVIIGKTPECGCMYNWVQVEMDANLPDGEGAKKLHMMLGAVGIGPVLGQQPKEADERMKVAQLFRAFYPAKATLLDRTKEFYVLPPDQLRERIEDLEPGMKAVFVKYLDKSPELMKKVEVMPGKEVWGVSDLGQQIREKGAWGLMTGVGNSGATSFDKWESGRRAAVRLLTMGAMSSEQRFKSGSFHYGASSDEDLMSGGGDQVFTRMVNNKVGKMPIEKFSFHGTVQVLLDIDSVAERVPYGFKSDQYGAKNEYYGNWKSYKDRPSLMELAETLDTFDTCNEVMVKNHLQPNHIVGLVVNDEEKKEELIQELVYKGLAEDRDGTIYLIKQNVKADDFIHFGDKFQKDWWRR